MAFSNTCSYASECVMMGWKCLFSDFHDCWAHWRVLVLLLWEYPSKADLLPNISQQKFLSQPGIIVKQPTPMHIIWADVIVYSASQQLIVIHGCSDAQVRQPDAYGIGTRVICLPSVCGSWLVSASWIFHEAAAIPGVHIQLQLSPTQPPSPSTTQYSKV